MKNNNGTLVTKGMLHEGLSSLQAELRSEIGMVIEKIDENNRLIMEILIPMKEKVDRIPKIEEDIAQIRENQRTANAALAATNAQVYGHEQRITRLEGFVA